jgi:DNA helicase II / ATP-dependent DNA helicase PcrA
MQTFKQYLHPLYKDVDKVADFSNLKELSDLERQEYPNLERVANIKVSSAKNLLKRLEQLEEELEHQIYLIDTEGDADAKMDAKNVYNQILGEIYELVERINRELIALDSPYFGKIQFQPRISKSQNPLSLYIGKFALIDEQTQAPLITDWRSPIANLYYENSGPTNDVSFDAPTGKREGDLLQKRQFQISRARIQGIYDAKSGNVAADEFLLSQLNERIGKKLQDIVSTIQAQQNSIIRDNLHKPIIIQGVAGSGKTTILLHRLAYIFYAHKEEISSNNSLIIAPNQMFIDYVSDVLPNLGISKVDTETYLFWGKSVLGWDNRYMISNEKEDLDIKGYKGSLEFIDVLEKYFEEFEKDLLENIPYSRKDIIERRYYELKEEFREIDMVERLDLAMEYAFAKKQFKQGNTGFYDATNDTDLNLKRDISAYFRKSCNIYSLYKNLFRSDLVDKATSKYTLGGLTQKGGVRNYRMEDLGPMVYLHFKINGKKLYEKDYVMVDEAQDMSFVQLATLIRIAKGGNITVAGDLAQSIIAPFYIRDWNDVVDLIKDVTNRDTEYYQLQKCYRTTIEIVEFANRIFKDRFPKSYKLPEAVLRHGDDVKILEYDTDIKDLGKDGIKELVNIMRNQFKKGAVTCAVLCKNRVHADILYDIFKKYEDIIERQVVSYRENDYRGGVLVLPIENAKGLEFDTVIFADLNGNYYTDSELDIRLLYVGITRALHRVFMVTKKEDSVTGLLLKT